VPTMALTDFCDWAGHAGAGDAHTPDGTRRVYETPPANGIWTPKLSYQRPENGEQVTSCQKCRGNCQTLMDVPVSPAMPRIPKHPADNHRRLANRLRHKKPPEGGFLLSL